MKGGVPADVAAWVEAADWINRNRKYGPQVRVVIIRRKDTMRKHSAPAAPAKQETTK